ncbi:MAG: hypothetical protein WBN92_02875, partial [Terriglobia bacterium]
MKDRKLLPVMVVLLLVMLTLCQIELAQREPRPTEGMSSTPADTVLLNGSIYTMNPRMPHAQAIAIRGDRIVFVGTTEGAARFKGPKSEVLDLD